MWFFRRFLTWSRLISIKFNLLSSYLSQNLFTMTFKLSFIMFILFLICSFLIIPLFLIFYHKRITSIVDSRQPLPHRYSIFLCNEIIFTVFFISFIITIIIIAKYNKLLFSFILEIFELSRINKLS